MFRTRTPALLLGAALASVAAPALAQPADGPSAKADPPTADRREPAYTTRWYGGETLLADALSVVTIASSGAARSNIVAYTGAAGFVLATPIIHFTHGNVGAGFASLGLRAGLPALGVAGAYMCPEDTDSGFKIDLDCQAGAIILGVGLDVLVVPPIDAALFAHERVRRRPEIGLVPMVDRNHAGLAIGGAF